MIETKVEIGVKIRTSKVGVSTGFILLSIQVFSSRFIDCFGLLGLNIPNKTFFGIYEPCAIFIKWSLVLSN